MSLLSGHMPHLPPAARSEPRGLESPTHDGSEPLRPREKNWTGKVGTAGVLLALRPADSDPQRGRRWWFLCKLCGRYCKREAWRVFSAIKNTGLVRTCGCGPRGGAAERKREQAMGRAA